MRTAIATNNVKEILYAYLYDMEAENLTIIAARRLCGKACTGRTGRSLNSGGMRAVLTVPGFHREQEPTLLMNALTGKHSVQ